MNLRILGPAGKATHVSSWKSSSRNGQGTLFVYSGRRYRVSLRNQESSMFESAHVYTSSASLVGSAYFCSARYQVR